MELYREDGRKAGLFDVCDWWIEKYPPDVFVKEPKPVVEARMCMQNILIKRVRVVPSSNSRKTKSAKDHICCMNDVDKFGNVKCITCGEKDVVK